MTTGPTSTDVVVNACLVEHYEALLPVPWDTSPEDRELIRAQCAHRAQAWLTLNGLEADLDALDRGETQYVHERNSEGAICLDQGQWVRYTGVAWDVTVGKGSTTLIGTAGSDDYQLAPDRAHERDTIESGIAWQWSVRWEHWAGWFHSMVASYAAQARAEGSITLAEFDAAMRDRYNGDTWHQLYDDAPQDTTMPPLNAVADVDITDVRAIDLMNSDWAQGHRWLDHRGRVWHWGEGQGGVHGWWWSDETRCQPGGEPTSDHGPYTLLKDAK